MTGSHTGPAPPKPAIATARQLTIEYLGFRTAGDRREYRLSVRTGADSWEYTISIAHSAFAAGHALMQDGPDICFQKLRRELLEAELAGGRFEMTENELREYRVAHAPPQRRTALSATSPPKPPATELLATRRG